MKLHELRSAAESTNTSKGKGRGTATGQRKTAGRGQDGQKSRSGGGTRPGFEGGQMPLYRRLPKRGFTNIFKKQWSIVNIEDLNRFDDETIITPELLKEAGMIRNLSNDVKILGNGDIEKKITVQAHKFSQSAVEKIESAGGKAEVI